MPTYQYSCVDCGHDLEAVQSFSDDALTVCPECGGTLRKRFGSVGVVFKGSGFYRTDSRSSGESKPAAASTTSSSDSSAQSSGSTPAAAKSSAAADKPAAKPATTSSTGSSSSSSSSATS